MVKSHVEVLEASSKITSRSVQYPYDTATADTRKLSEMLSKQGKLKINLPDLPDLPLHIPEKRHDHHSSGSGNGESHALAHEIADGALMAHLERIEGDASKAEAERRESSAKIVKTLTDTDTDNTSRHCTVRGMKPAEYTPKGINPTYTVEDGDIVLAVSGTATNENVIKSSLETRVGEAVQARKRVTAIDIRNSPVESLTDSVCAVFKQVEETEPRINTKGDEIYSSSSSSSAAVLGLAAMRFLLETQLKHLTISSSNLHILDQSVNRFDKLLTLDLSRNQLVKISGAIELPLLLSLNLSNNLLSSMHFLEGLRSLQYLNLSANCVTSLESSINNLIPLGRTLKHFDMAKNAVSSVLY